MATGGYPCVAIDSASVLLLSVLRKKVAYLNEQPTNPRVRKLVVYFKQLTGFTAFLLTVYNNYIRPLIINYVHNLYDNRQYIA